MKKMDPVVHFEMPAEDKERAKKFYEQVFGWRMQLMGAEMGNYLLATTAETDEKGMVKQPGAINGGFFEKGEYGNMPHIVVSVDNLEHSIESIKKSGGEIEGDKMDIPGIGTFVMFKDTEGNRIGMLKPTPMPNR